MYCGKYRSFVLNNIFGLSDKEPQIPKTPSTVRSGFFAFIRVFSPVVYVPVDNSLRSAKIWQMVRSILFTYKSML